MDQELKTRWVEALRGGEYTQGQGILRRTVEGEGWQEDQFCCLGVLADVAEPDAWSKERLEWNHHRSVHSILVDHDTYGVTEAAHAHLTGLNDGGGAFDEIADWIETNV